MDLAKTAVVAGHICLDVLPNLNHLKPGQFGELFQPGHIMLVGPVAFSTGGPVANTGLALHKLGIPTHLIAKVGADSFGGIIRELVEAHAERLIQGIVTDPASHTSYTIIINPPDIDRIFLHATGANDTFTADDIDYDLVAAADLFHFGYPPIMRQMYQAGGVKLVEVMRQARATGVTTSLDMAFPDPSSESGQADWHAILSGALPYVDLFLPSIEEILFMLHRDDYERMQANGGLLNGVTPQLLENSSRELMAMGAKIVGFKLGERGFYLHTGSAQALAEMGRAAPADLQAWACRSFWAPCFNVNVAGTTGSGDATIAGLLTALLHDLPPDQAVTMAAAVGACNVEAADATSGIRTWEETCNRVKAGWTRHPLEITEPGWTWNTQWQLWEHRG